MTHFLILTSTILAAVAATLGAAVSQGPTAHCPNAELVSTEVLGGGINITTYACPEGVHSLKPLHASRGNGFSSNADVFARQYQNCAGGAADPYCECAVLCGPLPFCYEGSVPVQSDCWQLASEFSSTPGSFYVSSGYYVSASYGSCELAWSNESSGTLEYCYENLGSLVTATFTNCMSLKGGGTGGCIGDDYKFFFEILETGNTIIVP